MVYVSTEVVAFADATCQTLVDSVVEVAGGPLQLVLGATRPTDWIPGSTADEVYYETVPDVSGITGPLGTIPALPTTDRGKELGPAEPRSLFGMAASASKPVAGYGVTAAPAVAGPATGPSLSLGCRVLVVHPSSSNHGKYGEVTDQEGGWLLGRTLCRWRGYLTTPAGLVLTTSHTVRLGHRGG